MTLMASESGGDHGGGGLSGYISHHLTHLASGKQKGLFDLSVVHWDTLFFSLLCAAIVLIAFGIAARRATSGVPGKFQSAVEMLVEMVDEQAKTLVKGKLTYIAPLALTVFGWVTLMNAIDLLPVDWLPAAAHATVGVEYLRPLPTADINATLGMAVGTLLLVFYYSLKIKGPGGWAHELVTAPFGMVKLSANPLTWIGALLLAVANLGMNIVEYCGRTLSHGMRLYGNMYAGELIFFLIAGLGGSLTVVGVAMHLITGTAWAIFHILIVLLQAFIFMMLTLVYIGQAHEHH
ncbi:MAG TPA: F0F1 ATP synthase subunit A [Steroidobacteraceae bacterium]|nr:F0F1 ATP synthase subunit A [Steroidobacteraceae bacterium]